MTNDPGRISAGAALKLARLAGLTAIFLMLSSCDLIGGLFQSPPSLSVSPDPGAGIEFAASADCPFRLILDTAGQNIFSRTWALDGGAEQSFGPGEALDLTGYFAVGQTRTLTLKAANSKAAVTKTMTLKRVDFPSGTDLGVPGDPVLPMGAVYGAQATTFRLWSPDSASVSVSVDTSAGTLSYSLAPVPYFGVYSGVYEAQVTGDLAGKSYRFSVNGTAVRDPYGRMIDHATGRNVVLDFAAIAPAPASMDAFRPALVSREDAIVSEIHIRDFSIHASSGVSAEKRGRYSGLWQSGTTLNGVQGAVSTGVDHLVELGVTHVQLLPFYDFHTKTYNWGYDPENYNIPEEEYSAFFDAVPYGPASGAYKDNAASAADFEGRVSEVRTMVDELHKKGLRVVMDVVYNHTYNTQMFSVITPKYYDGLNLSGVGNSIDAAHPMVRRFIRDSLEFWVKEYGVDGFRFDLLGIFWIDAAKDWGTWLNTRYPGRTLLLYGEPWNGYAADPSESGKVRMGKMPLLAAAGFGVFNSNFRETIKGDSDGTGRGYMFGDAAATDSMAADIARGVQGSLVWPGNRTSPPTALSNAWDRMFGDAPFQSINYISAHDNYCLWDKITAAGSEWPQAERDKIARLGMGIVLTSQGIPFLHGGDEFLRTKNMNRNSYNAPDSDNAINWQAKADNQGAFQTIKALIALRRANALFRLTGYDAVRAQVKSNKLTSGWEQNAADPSVQVITRLKDTGGLDRLVVIVNPLASGLTWTLPSDLSPGTWQIVLDENGARNPATDAGATVTIGARSVTVLKRL